MSQSLFEALNEKRFALKALNMILSYIGPALSEWSPFGRIHGFLSKRFLIVDNKKAKRCFLLLFRAMTTR